MIFWIWSITIVAAVVIHIHQVYSRFKRYGVKHFAPVPLFGNAFGIHQINYINKIYNCFSEERFAGFYHFEAPVIIVRDLMILKKILTCDLEHFLGRVVAADQKNDPLVARGLFSLKGKDWKEMRTTLSPVYTSYKIRQMVPFMVEVGEQMIKALKDKMQSSTVDYIDIEVKNLTSRYCIDVMASSALGLKINSNCDKPDLFYERSKEICDFLESKWMFIGLRFFPKLICFLKLTLFTEEIKTYFKQLVFGIMKHREERHIVKTDIINYLMEAKKDSLSQDKNNTTSEPDETSTNFEKSANSLKRMWSDDDLVAQVVSLIIAGIDPPAVGMTFLLYELALNPDVQEKLLQEIRQHSAKHGGKIDYKSIQHMEYLDMVISETLRLWPPISLMFRECDKDYNLGRCNDKATKDYIIRTHERLLVPVLAIHRDPKYFPDPLRFDPKRFSEQNKHKIEPYSYMPFGFGPRNCIGSRFALCELKIMIYQLLPIMELSPAAKIQIPPVLMRDRPNVALEGGHWVRFKIRK